MIVEIPASTPLRRSPAASSFDCAREYAAGAEEFGLGLDQRL